MFLNLNKFYTKLRYGYTKREERPDLKAEIVTRQTGAKMTKQKLNTTFSYTYIIIYVCKLQVKIPTSFCTRENQD